MNAWFLIFVIFVPPAIVGWIFIVTWLFDEAKNGFTRKREEREAYKRFKEIYKAEVSETNA